MHKGHLRLSGRPKRVITYVFWYAYFCTFKQPKRRIKTAAQSRTFSTDANAAKEPNF